MEFAGLVLIGIGVNTFLNGAWLLLYNAQSKRITKIENSLTTYFKEKKI